MICYFEGLRHSNLQREILFGLSNLSNGLDRVSHIYSRLKLQSSDSSFASVEEGIESLPEQLTCLYFQLDLDYLLSIQEKLDGETDPTKYVEYQVRVLSSILNLLPQKNYELEIACQIVKSIFSSWITLFSANKCNSRISGCLKKFIFQLINDIDFVLSTDIPQNSHNENEPRFISLISILQVFLNTCPLFIVLSSETENVTNLEEIIIGLLKLALKLANPIRMLNSASTKLGDLTSCNLSQKSCDSSRLSDPTSHNIRNGETDTALEAQDSDPLFKVETPRNSHLIVPKTVLLCCESLLCAMTRSYYLNDAVGLLLDRNFESSPLTAEILDLVDALAMSCKLFSSDEDVWVLHVVLSVILALHEPSKAKSVLFLFKQLLPDNFGEMPETSSFIIDSLGILAVRCVSADDDATDQLKEIIYMGYYPNEVNQNPYVERCALALHAVLANYSSNSIISVIYQLLSNVSTIAQDNQTIATNNPSITSPSDSLNENLASNWEETLNQPQEIGFEHIRVALNSIDALVVLANKIDEEKVYGLIINILYQSLSRQSATVMSKLLQTISIFALKVNKRQFIDIMKHIQSLSFMAHEYLWTLEPLSYCCSQIAENIDPSSESALLFISTLLTCIIQTSTDDKVSSKVPSSGKKKAVKQDNKNPILTLLRPLSIILKRLPYPIPLENSECLNLFRNAWLSLVCQGFYFASNLTVEHAEMIRDIASKSPPLILDNFTNDFESELELNTVLRARHNSEDKSRVVGALLKIFPKFSTQIRSMKQAEVEFLSAVCLIEYARTQRLNCITGLTYFFEPSLRNSRVAEILAAHLIQNAKTFSTMIANDHTVSNEHIFKSLESLLCLCAHRIERVHQLAVDMAHIIFTQNPVLLCSPVLFYLLEILNIIWEAASERFTNCILPKQSFSSNRIDLTILVPDDFDRRDSMFLIMHEKAKTWLAHSADVAPDALKGSIQAYLNLKAFHHNNETSIGQSLALDIGRRIMSPHNEIKIRSFSLDATSSFLNDFSSRRAFSWPHLQPKDIPTNKSNSYEDSLKAKILEKLQEYRRLGSKCSKVPFDELRYTLQTATGLTAHQTIYDATKIIKDLVAIPFFSWKASILRFSVELWTWIINEQPNYQYLVICEISKNWFRTIHKNIGFFSSLMNSKDPMEQPAEYAPSDKALISKIGDAINSAIAPHQIIINMLHGHYFALIRNSYDSHFIFESIVLGSLNELINLRACFHALSRNLYFKFLNFAHDVWTSCDTKERYRQAFLQLIIRAGLVWFHCGPHWPYGGNSVQVSQEISEITKFIKKCEGSKSLDGQTESERQGLLCFLKNERYRLRTWLQAPELSRSQDLSQPETINDEYTWRIMYGLMHIESRLCYQFCRRFGNYSAARDIWTQLICSYPRNFLLCPDAATHISMGPLPRTDAVTDNLEKCHQYLCLWSVVPPMTALALFLSHEPQTRMIFQFAIRSFEHFSVDVTFFCVPQIVQALRYDKSKYIQRLVIEISQKSDYFAHQVIWNIRANSYKNEDGTIPDPMKPLFDEVISRIQSSFTDAKRSFFVKEFNFFDQVTSISGKLRPFIKLSKVEKKAKIDEEMAKITISEGVYLPSNPEDIVIGIDAKAGRPLQSHAKAPFMATFIVRRHDKRNAALQEIENQVNDMCSLESGLSDDALNYEADVSTVANKEDSMEDEVSEEYTEFRQSAIFKVGDDCRQDILILQLTSIFRTIFMSAGLEVFLYPYRVTATGPGMGVIDVLPNSVSRDMLGREAVNGLYDYFITKFGNEDSESFQIARAEFVQSMASYSIITYLLQIKDRHNGNIMIDDLGHILHIDFGFCFDIAPGGIQFEASPFKLSPEMVRVMGGPNHQAYYQFKRLCVRSYLTCREYMEQICHGVLMMLDSGLPCFKGQSSIVHLRKRFMPDATEAQAVKHVINLIDASYENMFTKAYDQYQKLTNGIPY